MEKPNKWPTYMDWDSMMMELRHMYREGKFPDGIEPTVQALLYAWERGTVTLQKPLE